MTYFGLGYLAGGSNKLSTGSDANAKFIGRVLWALGVVHTVGVEAVHRVIS